MLGLAHLDAGMPLGTKEKGLFQTHAVFLDWNGFKRFVLSMGGSLRLADPVVASTREDWFETDLLALKGRNSCRIKDRTWIRLTNAFPQKSARGVNGDNITVLPVIGVNRET